MKKSILLGVAAMAAVAMAAPQAADAGETKLGGYYQFRTQHTDNTPGDVAGDENAQYWAQRLQLNVDFKASDKSHAHLMTRILDTNIVDGANSVFPTNGAVAGATQPASADWQVRKIWLETEAWGVGLKVGNMPLGMNDEILFGVVDDTSWGSALISKNIGGVTLIGGLNKIQENGTAVGLTNGQPSDEQDLDFWVISALGKFNTIDYQLTGALMQQQKSWSAGAGGGGNAAAFNVVSNGTGATVNLTDDVTDGWIALTLGSKIEGIDLTGTIIYETGMENVTPGSQLENDGFLAALRAKGNAGFGGWNGYVFYAGEDFTAAYPGGNNPKWSPTWDQGGTGAQDLMEAALTGTSAATNKGVATDTSNMWGIGAGLNIKAGAWTIAPSLDYAALVEDMVSAGTTVATNANYDSAWGGTLGFSTKIQEATTLDISGTFVDPKRSTTGVGVVNEDTLHYVQASVKMAF